MAALQMAAEEPGSKPEAAEQEPLALLAERVASLMQFALESTKEVTSPRPKSYAPKNAFFPSPSTSSQIQ